MKIPKIWRQVLDSLLDAHYEAAQTVTAKWDDGMWAMWGDVRDGLLARYEGLTATEAGYIALRRLAIPPDTAR